MTKCRTCQAEIVWGKTEAGKNVPLDPPEKRYVRADMITGMADLAKEDEYVMVPTFVSHFATCPQADQHRKKDKPLPGSTEDYRGDHDDG